MEISEASLQSSDSLLSEALSPALTTPMFSSPSAFPLICSLNTITTKKNVAQLLVVLQLDTIVLCNCEINLNEKISAT